MGGRLGRECLRLGVSRSPGNLGIAGRRPGMNSLSAPTLAASSARACTHARPPGTGGSQVGRAGRVLLLSTLTSRAPAVGAGGREGGAGRKGCRGTPLSTPPRSVPGFLKKNTHIHGNLIHDLKSLYPETRPGRGAELAPRKTRRETLGT